METSSDRILFTHVGSLPRNPNLKSLLLGSEGDRAVSGEHFNLEVLAATRDAIARQIDAGVDIISNGELARPGFQTYIPQRMSGFGGISKRKPPIDIVEFPGLAKMMAPAPGSTNNRAGLAVGGPPAAIAEVRYEDLSQARHELDVYSNAVTDFAGQYVDRFMTAPSPGIIATTMLNEHYDSHERYVEALTREIAKEYRLIVESGLVLQIDAPDLAMERTIMYQDDPVSTYLAAVEMYVAAINTAIEGLPTDRLRLHCCYGNFAGPHLHDIALREVLPIVYQAKVGALSLAFANPRHQHEYPTLKELPLPDSMLLLPGVIDSTTNYVEHPQVVANRICEAVDAIGDRERVIASTDCGFGTFVAYELVVPEIVWKKFEAGAQGARLATATLWGH